MRALFGGALLVVLIGGAVSGQSMVESAAAAAGGSAGGVAGKKVSDGLTRIFNKIDQHTAKAAEDTTKKTTTDADTPLFQVGPGVPKDISMVPPPPPAAHRAAVHTKPAPVHTAAAVPIPIPPPPPPEVTADELRTVTSGMRRDDVLKLGAPSVRITMFDEGHLIEIYRYAANDTTVGAVHLTDGAVSRVLIR